MESLKIDRTKLITISNYAKRYNISRPTIYEKIKNKELKTVVIDGLTFIHL
jgi:excisionase family DNA binding protein